VSGRKVEISNPGKIFFPGLGATKLDVVGYYLEVAEPILRATRGRPAMLQRFPDGALGKSFFQKRVPPGAPEWLQTIEVSTPNGTTSRALVIADIAHIVWAVNLGCLGFHIWPFRVDDPEHADELRIDLDPQAGVVFGQVREAAACVKELLDELGILAYPKTSGNRGLHVYARLAPYWDSIEVRAGAVALARELERRRPDLVTANWWKEERGQRVFVDFNQNAPHKTVFGALSARSRTNAQVSTPLFWDEVSVVDPDELTIATVPERLRRLGDPWSVMADQPQSLEPLLEMAARDREAGLRDAPWPPQYPKQPDEPSRVAPSRAKKD
jgi:DNA ligase D